MATVEDVDAMDDDKWLYGDDLDATTPEEHSDAVVEALLGDNNIRYYKYKEGTPDLDEIEATSGLSQIAVNKITSNAPELQLKTLQSDSVSIAAEDAEPTTEENGLKRDEEGVAGEEDSSDDDDDDDVKITIGTILNPASAYARPGFGRIPQLPGAGGEGVAPVKKVDMDAVPLINGVPLPEVDIEESILDKPWRKPGADITDYFNYGFTEETWRLYCEKQRKMRHEVNQLNKLVVTTAGTIGTPKIEISKPMFGFPMMDMAPPQAVINANPALIHQGALSNDTAHDDSESIEEKGTPPPEVASILPPKLPILPPPGLPPPSLPFPPPQDVNAAAAMAAMFTGGPPPPIRPPDFPPGFPPPMHGAIPFPPPMPGEMRPPFLPPGFSIGSEPPRGPITLDDPRAAIFNAELGFPPPWVDPSMTGHDVIEQMQSGDFRRNSRSPSRSSSNSSRGSSVERRHSSRREKGREKYERSSHHRSRRSRSHDRSHHRSSRRDHRDHRDRDHRDRRDRHEKERRDRRRRDERRHERSSKRHRSRTPDDDEEIHDKKRSRSRSAS